MNLFLKLSFLFFLGATGGWVLELFFRHFTSPTHKWVNPGFCTGPYVPLYGFGLCAMYLLGQLRMPAGVWGEALRVIAMGAAATALEYLAGILLLQYYHVRLWDYSRRPGNIQGLICPLFTFFWMLLGAAYYYLLNPYVQRAVDWLANNLAYSFVVGMFFGVFLVDVVHSAQLIAKLKRFAEENQVIVRFEQIKERIHTDTLAARQRYHFFRPFHAPAGLPAALKALREDFEQFRRK